MKEASFLRTDSPVTLKEHEFDVSHASLLLWPSEPTCSVQHLVLASLSTCANRLLVTVLHHQFASQAGLRVGAALSVGAL